jgi:hypothetical protein
MGTMISYAAKLGFNKLKNNITGIPNNTNNDDRIRITGTKWNAPPRGRQPAKSQTRAAKSKIWMIGT